MFHYLILLILLILSLATPRRRVNCPLLVHPSLAICVIVFKPNALLPRHVFYRNSPLSYIDMRYITDPRHEAPSPLPPV